MRILQSSITAIWIPTSHVIAIAGRDLAIMRQLSAFGRQCRGSASVHCPADIGVDGVTSRRLNFSTRCLLLARKADTGCPLYVASGRRSGLVLLVLSSFGVTPRDI